MPGGRTTQEKWGRGGVRASSGQRNSNRRQVSSNAICMNSGRCTAEEEGNLTRAPVHITHPNRKDPTCTTWVGEKPSNDMVLVIPSGGYRAGHLAGLRGWGAGPHPVAACRCASLKKRVLLQNSEFSWRARQPSPLGSSAAERCECSSGGWGKDGGRGVREGRDGACTVSKPSFRL